MANQVQEAIKQIEENKELIEALRQAGSVKERLDKLMELLPGAWLWDPMSARQLVYYLQKAYKIDFGVCDFYKIEGDKQYCNAGGKWVECLCAIPEAYCVIRDKDGKPKYPEFSFIKALENLDS